MALSAWIELSCSSQNVAGNYSNVYVKFMAKTTNNTHNDNNKSGYIKVNGSHYTSFTHKLPKASTTILWSGTIQVNHNSNGAGSVSVSGGYEANVGGYSTITASNSLTLPTIPRVSDLSVNKSSVPADESTTVIATATKKSSSFTDTITVSLGSYSKVVTSGTAFTIPKTWINAISGTSATATVTVTTKSGSTTIGTKSVNLTVTVPDSVVPTVSSISASEAITAVTTAFGNRFVRSLSQLNVKVNAAGVYGSTIKSYAVTLDGVKYQSEEFQSNALNTAGSVDIVATVTDSRGRTRTLTKTITVVDYSAPAITNMTYYPCDANGNRNPNGTNTKVIINGLVASVAGQNSRSLILKYKAMDAATYTALTLTTSSWSFEVSTIVSGTDPTSTWEFIATLTDKISSIENRIVTGAPVISRLAGGKGVRLFGEAQNEGFWVGNIDYTITDAEYQELMNLLGGVARLIDWIYPVGHIITTVNASYDPNKLFKNQTWVRFANGRTLVGVDDSDTSFDAVEKMGGSKTVKLTESEMPAHPGHMYTNTGSVWGGNTARYLSSDKLTAYGSSARGWNVYNGNEAQPAGRDQGGSKAHNNLQPYITVYFWKRTA